MAFLVTENDIGLGLKVTNTPGAAGSVVDFAASELPAELTPNVNFYVASTAANPDGARVFATKRVVNPGAALPIADVADAGAQSLLFSGKFDFAETNDIIVAIGADGAVRAKRRRLGLRVHRFSQAGVATNVASNAISAVELGNTIDLNEGAFTYAASTTQIVCVVPGRYSISMNGVAAAGGVPPGTIDVQPLAASYQPEIRHHIYVNGALLSYVSVIVPAGLYGATRNVAHVSVVGVADLNAGDIIEGRIRNLTTVSLVGYFSNVFIERL